MDDTGRVMIEVVMRSADAAFERGDPMGIEVALDTAESLAEDGSYSWANVAAVAIERCRAALDMLDVVRCPKCGGGGEVQDGFMRRASRGYNAVMAFKVCPACKGSGRITLPL